MILVEISEVSLSELDSERLWGRYIDRPKPNTYTGAYAAELIGWVLGKSSPAVAIELLHDGKVIRRLPLNHRRPDIAEAFPKVEGAQNSGFHATVSLLGATPELEVSLQAVLKDQSRVSVGVIRGRRRWREVGSVINAAWEAGKDVEVAFWREWLVTEGLQWPEDYKARLNPEQPLQDRIIEHLNSPPGATVSILDVGAGPLTKLGKKWEGRTVHITAVDPLAEEYKRLLAQFGITPPVRTQVAEVERLTQYFPEDHFDLVNMENALDHSYNPLRGLRQMIHVVKPGCYVSLLHNVNDAHNTGHVGFHQWNCCADNGSFVIWNSYTRVSVNAALEDVAQVREITVHNDDDLSEGFITVSLRKRA